VSFAAKPLMIQTVGCVVTRPRGDITSADPDCDIVGHRIRVADIAGRHERRGDSPSEIVSLFPGLPLADVHAALAYYFDNRADVDLSRQGVQLRPSRLRDRL
jgi:uncharacterized protein (DUF433 family)